MIPAVAVLPPPSMVLGVALPVLVLPELVLPELVLPELVLPALVLPELVPPALALPELMLRKMLASGSIVVACGEAGLIIYWKLSGFRHN